MLKGYKVIDADGHFYEPIDIWDKYIEAEFYERRPKVIEYRGRALMDYELDGKIFTKPRLTFSPHSLFSTMEYKYGDAYRSWWNMETRIKDMDRFGWDLQVCLPTNGHLGAAVSRTDVKLGAALARAYNNWAYEFSNKAPHRIKFVSVVPGGDVEEQVIETRRSVEQLGAVSIVLPTVAPGKMWHQPDFDPLWQTAVDLSFPLSLHGSGTGSGVPEANARYNEVGGAFRALHQAINFPFENMISLGHFMYSGILDRFPTLRISILESNCGWVPFWLNRLEKYAEGRQAVFFADHPIQHPPQEYFKRQCYIACDADEPSIKYTIDYIGDDQIVFNTDYPHPDAPDPWEPLPGFLAQPISDASKKKILWDNSVKLYGPRLLEKTR